MGKHRRRRRHKPPDLTPAQYQALLAHGDGGCWICGRKPTGRRLHREHDHKTKLMRGLTCFRCNILLERARDDPGILRRAADYLETDVAERILAEHAKA